MILEDNYIEVEDLRKIAFKIKNDFFTPLNTVKTTIFLCGGEINKKDTIRAKIASYFTDRLNSLSYDIIYPEDLFDELLYSSHGKDLLSLENLLAESVDVILIIPESAGSFTELGAFANTSSLQGKILCLVDSKYRKHKSFINQGPVKLIKKLNKFGVIYISPLSLQKELSKIRTSIRKIKANSDKKEDKISLLQLEHFLLPAIYLLEPVSKNLLNKCVEFVNEDDLNSYHATTASLTILTKKKLIELTTDGYKLTKVGLDIFLNLRKTGKVKTFKESLALDNMRLEILNLMYRKKKLRV